MKISLVNYITLTLNNGLNPPLVLTIQSKFIFIYFFLYENLFTTIYLLYSNQWEKMKYD